MGGVKMVWSESRGTWNVFLDAEWYFEGTFEQCCDIVNMFNCPEEPEYNESGEY